MPLFLYHAYTRKFDLFKLFIIYQYNAHKKIKNNIYNNITIPDI